jgi:prepilin peptidase CpaA
MVKMIDVISSISVLLFLYAAWTDFRTWKIPNTIVLALVTLYALRAVAVMLGSEDVGAALLPRAELAATSGPVC